MRDAKQPWASISMGNNLCFFLHIKCSVGRKHWDPDPGTDLFEAMYHNTIPRKSDAV